MPIDTGQRRRVASERRSKPGQRSWNRRSRGAQARAIFTPTTHCLGGAVCGRASAKHRQQTPVHFGRPKPGKLCTQPKPHKPSLATGMSVSPSAQTAVPVDPANAAPRCGCAGCESFWLPQLRRLASWIGLLQDQHQSHIRPAAAMPALHSKSIPQHRQRERADTPHQPGSLEAPGSENGHSPLTTVATTPALRRRVTPQSAEHATQLLHTSNGIVPVEILSRCVQTDAPPNPISGPASGRRCLTHHVSLQLPSVDNSSLPTQ